NIILLGTPASGYQFEKWNDGADDIFHNPITVSTAGSYEASFIDSSSPSNGYNVTAAADANGKIQYATSGSMPVTGEFLGTATIHVNDGETVTLTGAATAANYAFEKWTQTSPIAAVFSHNPMTVSTAGSYEASFIDSSAPGSGYDVDATAGANGSFGYEIYVGMPTGT
ncbi:MAG: hypothetical protein LBT41_03785, partial [Candidatus Methanoplasma sp.]|nr:hypothetical protein [Candidatus Methanoplasma sp.]